MHDKKSNKRKKGEKMERYLMISDAAKEVQVESHVLRYWEEELPTPEEYREAVRNLELHGNEVDYILTHTAPREMIRRMGCNPDPHEMELAGFLEYVMYQIKHRHWYCGHWHMDRDLTDRFTALWYDTRKLE